jgi:hypothetical protein
LFAVSKRLIDIWCRGTELNCRHQPFQGCALPTELPRHAGRLPLLPSSSHEIKEATTAYSLDWHCDTRTVAGIIRSWRESRQRNSPLNRERAVLSKRITLVGDCNRCGVCCEVEESDGVTLRCENLEVLGPIGQPWASKCRAYLTRYDGMPIRLYDIRTGQLSEDEFICPKNSPADSQAETETILSHGIGLGCSLTVMEKEN